jgi:hypothetical protein
MILNNPPVAGMIPDQTVLVGETLFVDLSSYESDLEDSGNDLGWSVFGVDASVLDAYVQNKILVIEGVSLGADHITLMLEDLDGDSDSQEILVTVTDAALCNSDADCDDGNDLTYDECVNPGQSNAMCVNTPIACADDMDCGTDGYTGAPVCQNGDVYQDFTSYMCTDGGSLSASCASSTQIQLKESCQYGCNNGACVNESQIVCFDDTDCGTDGFTGQPFCQGDNVYQDFTSYMCTDGGSLSASCSSDSDATFVEHCEFGCFGGTCANESDIKCFTNADCPSDGFTGDRFCRSGHVYGTIAGYSCVDGGTPYSACVSEEQFGIIEYCESGCSDGRCRETTDFLDRELYIDTVSLSTLDRFETDDELYLSVTLENHGAEDLDDLRVRALVFDLGVYYSYGKMDLDSGESRTISEGYLLPYSLSPGTYDVRVVISNDDIERVVHREVVVR